MAIGSLSIGLALIGIGVSVEGALSTVLIVAGLLLGALALPIYLMRSRGRPAGDTASDDSTAQQTEGDRSPTQSASGLGPITQVGGNYYEGVPPPQTAPPQIVFREHEFGEGALWWPPQWPGRAFRSLVIPVANDPPTGVQADRAEHVCAYLTIQLPDGSKPFDGVQARWTAKPQAGQRSKYQALDSTEVREMILPPNGASFRIDTILYLQNEQEIRPYTEAGPQSEITADSFEVHVRVRGTNMDKTSRYRIDRTPDNPFDGFEVTPILLMRIPSEPPAYDDQNPYTQARRLERDWRSKKLGAALLSIRQELVVNQRRLKKLLERGISEGFAGFSSAQWTKHEDRVREDAPGVCVLADQAYGLIMELREAELEDAAAKLLTDHDRELGQEALNLFERTIAEIDRGQP